MPDISFILMDGFGVKKFSKVQRKVTDIVPTLKIRELIQLWQNCVRYLSDPAQHKKHREANDVIAAISKEWERRGRQPLNGDEHFEWPSTDARAGKRYINTSDWLSEGFLSLVGYRVGRNEGLSLSYRQRILSEVFRSHLPPVFPKEYIEEWGAPESSKRLQKMAETIAALTRNARRRGSLMETAIKHWEKDLEFLYYDFYVEKFHFGWPSTTLV